MTVFDVQQQNLSSKANDSTLSTNTTTSPAHHLLFINCSAFQSIASPLNAVSTLCAASIILCNLFNLAVFLRWRQKSPFMHLHVSLTVSSLLVGLSGLSSPISRSIAWTPTVELMATVGVLLFLLSHRISVTNTLCISVERWVSVEFPIWYRNHVTKRGIIVLAVIAWLTALVITLPGYAIFRRGIDVACNRPFTMYFLVNGTRGDDTQAFFGGLARSPFLIPILAAFQIRILVIAVETKLRLIGIRRRPQLFPQPLANNLSHSTGQIVVASPVTARPQKPTSAVRIVWGTLLGSMTVVVGSALANIPSAILESWGTFSSNGALVHLIEWQNYLHVLQYIYTPVIYVLFFPDFRAIVVAALVDCRDCLRAHV